MIAIPDAGLDPKEFYRALVEEIERRRGEASPEVQSFGAQRALDEAEVIEWLRFQTWYEREAANFIGAWLADVPEDDAFHLLARQVNDEARHHKLFLARLHSRNTDMGDWEPEPEWVEWIQQWYPAGDDTLERVAAHNITGELGAIQAFEDLSPRLPEDVREVIRQIGPDEKFHVSLGRTLVHKYATTGDAQRRVADRALGAFECEQRGRIAFERRARQLAATR